MEQYRVEVLVNKSFLICPRRGHDKRMAFFFGHVRLEHYFRVGGVCKMRRSPVSPEQATQEVKKGVWTIRTKIYCNYD